jgi:transcriptional regulator with XRE-family HTH domain
MELGLTMKQVAEAVGVSEGTISRWESGEISNMKRSRIAALAKVLKMKPSEIVLGTDSEDDSNEASDIDKEFAQLLSAMSDDEKIWLLNVIKSVIEGRK